MRIRSIATVIALICICSPGVPASAAPRGQAELQVQGAAPAENKIIADSAPYRIEWNGTSGVFIRKAFAQEPEISQSMTFLHTDAGPAGFAQHLAWFLARDAQGFSLLWCYLNGSGSEFDCWLYRFPSNQLTSLHFTGAYQFAPPQEPAPPLLMNDFKLSAFPPYVGPAFAFRDWTKTVGALAQLDLHPTKQARQSAATPARDSAVKAVTQLIVRPLHQVQVGSANGWRDGGWNELHALARDAAGDAYYLILYSNTPKGYVVDLKRAQIYTTDFGGMVDFEGSQGAGAGTGGLDVEPDIKVRRYDRHEIVLKTSEKFSNPYVDVQVGIEFLGPDAKPVTVPGFWDGTAFRVRFTPALPGRWTWRSISKVSDLNGETGVFECLNENPGVNGFVNVQPNHRDTHHFAYSDGDPFLPVALREPAPTYSALPTQGRAGPSTGAVQLTRADAQAADEDTGSFVAFQRFVNAAAQKGFNRFVGGALLGPTRSKLVRSNEGGSMVAGADLDRINPVFFTWMDRRVAYCNAHGIVPDIGIGALEDALFTTYKPESLFRLWAYVVARYASYDVQWNLFEPGDGPGSSVTRQGAEQFAELTRLYDPNHHPITMTLPGGTAAVAPSTSGEPREGRAEQDRAEPGTAAPRSQAGAMAGSTARPKQSVPYDLPWEDVITVQGGDVNALPWVTWIQKPLVLVERPTVGNEAALTPEVARHRMWETRMRGAYWASGITPSLDVSSLNDPRIQWSAYCGDLFRRTRFYRLTPRPEMLGGPLESPADRRRRKKAEAAAGTAALAPSGDTQPPGDFDPSDSDIFGDLPPLPAPKPTPMFVLADPAHEYLVYFEQGGSLLLDLLEATGKVQVVWFNPRTGESTTPKEILGGAYTSFTAPDGNDWILYVSRR